MLGGEIVEHLDENVLNVRQRARRDDARQAAPLSTRVLHPLARRLKIRLDMGQCRRAQLRPVSRFGTRERRQVAAERVIRPAIRGAHEASNPMPVPSRKTVVLRA